MEQALYQAAVTTFENLGYMFPLEDGADPLPPAGETVNVKVGFHGSITGRMELEVEEGLLEVVASNMLGDEGPHLREFLYDAIGEVANVITGNALAEIAGKKEVFKLEPPAVDAGSSAGGASAAANIALDEGCARVSIYLN